MPAQVMPGHQLTMMRSIINQPVGVSEIELIGGWPQHIPLHLPVGDEDAGLVLQQVAKSSVLLNLLDTYRAAHRQVFGGSRRAQAVWPVAGNVIDRLRIVGTGERAGTKNRCGRCTPLYEVSAGRSGRVRFGFGRDCERGTRGSWSLYWVPPSVLRQDLKIAYPN